MVSKVNEEIMVYDDANIDVEISKSMEPPVNMRRRVWPQHTAALLATLLSLSGGIVLGWSTPAVPYLQEALPLNDGTNRTTVPITDEEGSWLGSLSSIGALLCATPAGFLSDLVGRKRMLLIFSLPLIASWIMIIFAERNLPLLYLARMLGGSTPGVTYAVIPIYSEEISEVRTRGTIVIYCEIMACAGVELAFVMGTCLSYLHFHIMCLVPPVLFLLTFVWMPESPMWLLMKGRDEEAERSLRWLRGVASGEDKGISKELQDMKEFLTAQGGHPLSESDEKLIAPDIAVGFWSRPSVKATIIVFWLMVFMQMNGTNAVMYNSLNVYKDAHASIDSNVATMITGLLQLAAAVVSCFVVDRTGRRPLLFIATAVSCLLLVVMSLYFNFKDQLQGVSWLPVFILNALIFNVEFGIGPLPWLIMAELTPSHAKKTVGAICCATNWCLVFIVTKTYTNMISALGLPMTYGVYAMFCFAGIFFVYFGVPETKHKTREQIQCELRFGKHSIMPTAKRTNRCSM